MHRILRLLLTVAVIGLILAGCGSEESGSAGATATESAGTKPEQQVSGGVTAFAAASLTEAFTEMGDAFMIEFPEATVTFSFASSSELVTQINEGAPADVYASADQSNMSKLIDAGGNAGDPAVFATNSLEIIVEPGNPQGITAVSDLANPDLIIVTCAPEVPIGKYTAEVFTNAGVTVTPKSFEESVKGVVSKVTLGEADAGIVYKTDVNAAGDRAEGIEIPVAINVTAEYPVVVTKAATNAVAAQAFVDFVLSEQGLNVLAGYGFTAP